MPTLNALIHTGTVCQFLREKKMFYQVEDVPGPAAMEILPAAEAWAALPAGPFWCAQTQTLLGPDGQVADAQRCRPGRSCCETA